MMIIGLTFGNTYTVTVYALGHAIGFPAPFAATYPVAPGLMAMFGLAYFLV